ncbi:arginine deiminase-related protein [Bacteroidota bacterium]
MNQLKNTIVFSFPKKEIFLNQNILEGVVSKLQNFGFTVLRVESLGFNYESVGIGNWITFHKKNLVAVYPLMDEAYRDCRNNLLFSELESKGIVFSEVIDYTEAETEGYFLEGNKSFVLDNVNNVAYASESKFTDEDLFIEFCEDFEYTPIVFSAINRDGCSISFTSSILMVGEEFAIVASSLIKDKKERKLVMSHLKQSGKDLVYVTEQQCEQHICSVVQLTRINAKNILVMAKKIHQLFTCEQLEVLQKHNELLVVDFDSCVGDVDSVFSEWIVQVN